MARPAGAALGGDHAGAVLVASWHCPLAWHSLGAQVFLGEAGPGVGRAGQFLEDRGAGPVTEVASVVSLGAGEGEKGMGVNPSSTV